MAGHISNTSSFKGPVHGNKTTTTTATAAAAAATNNNTTTLQFVPPGSATSFELPISTPDEDIISINNVLTALMNVGSACPICYKIKSIETGYVLRAVMPASDIFEFSLEDLLYLHSVSPARVERVCVARSSVNGPCEIVVKLLNSKQRIMIVSTLQFATATHKRKWLDLP
jgi:hypothetical protein